MPSSGTMVVPDPGPDTEAVGRVGELILEYSRQEDRTVLARARSRSPWHCFPPAELDDGACAYSLLVNPGGGLVGGDRLSVRATIGPGAHALISTPSANRIYRSTDQAAEQSVELRVERDAVLEWLPEPTIPFAGARYRQRLSVEVATGAALIFWEVLAAGRIACGERWAFAELDNDIRITHTGAGAAVERYRIGTEAGGIGLAQTWNYVASVYAIGDRMDLAARGRLMDRVACLIESWPNVLAGVSEPAIPGVAVRLLAKSAMELREGLEGIWGAARAELLGRSAPALRRY